MRALAILLLLPAIARADSLTAAATPDDSLAFDHRFALAVNEPVSLVSGHALGVSGYMALTTHQAIRLNAATWKTSSEQDDMLTFLISGGGSSEGGDPGRHTDLSGAWMYFPRRVFDGPSIELGALTRWRSTSQYVDDFSADTRSVTSTKIAARALVGWSWLFYDRMFISAQLGLTVGREKGTQDQTQTDEHMLDLVTPVDQIVTSPEFFVRIGVVL